MPQISPLPWLLSLLLIWVLIISLMSNMWWSSYMKYLNLKFIWLKKKMFKW
uniref:ATP synthase F0 subunit 8 n=1 Tax=Poecilobdella javanica TaxID=1348077 RepID=UPI001F146058|nr:ATP synthase F0 subunit 8 [Poecilobdella javanica]ULO25924.1 ATP synthase F0 subunit 8 [Poecilobdella javanica]